MPSYQKKAGERLANYNNRRRANQLIDWLSNRLVLKGVLLNTDERRGIHDWMHAAFIVGVTRGKALQRNASREGR